MVLARADHRQKTVPAARGGRGGHAAAVQPDRCPQPAALCGCAAGVLFCRRPDLLVECQMPAAGRHRGQHRCHPRTRASPSRTWINCSPANSIRSGNFRIWPRACARMFRRRRRTSPCRPCCAAMNLSRWRAWSCLANWPRISTQKWSFPPEATDGVADEQYLRNVVDVLYRARTEKRTAVAQV